MTRGRSRVQIKDQTNNFKFKIYNFKALIIYPKDLIKNYKCQFQTKVYQKFNTIRKKLFSFNAEITPKIRIS